LTTVKKVSQRGLVAVVIMLPLIFVFYSLGDAATQTVNIPCTGDIDDIINKDDRGIATRFVLTANCPASNGGQFPRPYVASATIVPSNGDEVACAVEPEFVKLTPGTDSTAAWDPNPYCTVAGNASVENVFRPVGQGGTLATVSFRGITITGGNFTGSSGTGTAIAEGSMTNASYHYGIEVRDNEAAGINNAKGIFDKVELTNNTTNSKALGFIGSGMKATSEVEVKNSYIHHTQGNGIWCNTGCVDARERGMNGFWVHDNLVVSNDRAGIRYENAPQNLRSGVHAAQPTARIENNEVHDNSAKARRGGVSIANAQNALVQGNIFGAKTIAGVAYPANDRGEAIRATDSGRASITDLYNVDIVNNTLNGETIRGCELPDAVVDCTP
jgi:hypothetical protein